TRSAAAPDPRRLPEPDLGSGDEVVGRERVLVDAGCVLVADLADGGGWEALELAADHCLAGGPGAVEVWVVRLDHDDVFTDEVEHLEAGWVLDGSEHKVPAYEVHRCGGRVCPALADAGGLSVAAAEAFHRHRDPRE